MSSRKETKTLMEGLRRFINEAEEKKIIRIIDFDGTIFTPPEQYKLIKNPFYMGALSDEGFELVYLNVIEQILENSPVNPQYAKLNPKTDYVVSAVKSFGGSKPVDYWHGLLQKNDPKLIDFMKNYLKVEPSVENLKFFGAPALEKIKSIKHNFIEQITKLPKDNVFVVSNKDNDSKTSAVKAIVTANGVDSEYICIDNDPDDLRKMQSAVNVAKGKPEAKSEE